MGYLPLMSYPFCPGMTTFFIPASTCYRKPYPEPARLSRASQSSSKAFTLECLRARGIIFTQVETSGCITTPFLMGDSCRILRRFPIRYSCSGTVCLFVWSVGADKPITYSPYRESTSCTACLFWKSCLAHPGNCHLLNLSSAYKTIVTPPPQRHTALQSTILF